MKLLIVLTFVLISSACSMRSHKMKENYKIILTNLIKTNLLTEKNIKETEKIKYGLEKQNELTPERAGKIKSAISNMEKVIKTNLDSITVAMKSMGFTSDQSSKMLSLIEKKDLTKVKEYIDKLEKEKKIRTIINVHK